MEQMQRLSRERQTKTRLLSILAAVTIAVANLLLLQTAFARSAAPNELSIHNSYLEANNSAPVIDLNGPDPNHNYTTTFTENQGPRPIVASSMTISDTDSPALKSAEVVLTNREDGSEEYLEINTENTNISANYDPGTGKLSLSSNDTISNYQKALSTITYNNLSESPAIVDRTITFQLFDGTNVSEQAVSTVLIEPVNDAPQLDDTGEFRLSSIEEDDTNQVGNRVATFIDPAETGGEDNIVDPDTNSVEGIAVISVDNGNGSWQYSVDAGSTWREFGQLTNTSAVLLDPTARIRFQPEPNYHGSTSLLFRAWDQTAGENGDNQVDVSVNGGSSPFSSAAAVLNLEVLAVNDPPVADLNGRGPGSNLAINHLLGSGPVSITAPQATIEDVDNQELTSVIITLKTRPDGSKESLRSQLTSPRISIEPYDPRNGKLRLSGSATIAEYNEIVRSIVYENVDGNPSTAVRIIEFVVNDGQDDGPTTSTSLHLLHTNNAPILNSESPLMLDTINEDEADPAGNTITDILNASAADPIQDDEEALRGLAVVGATTSDGHWQYSVDNGTSWWPMGTVANNSAVLLNSEARIRFLPNPNAGGFERELTVRAWDQTSGANGSYGVDVTQNGGSTAFSEQTTQVTIEVIAVNDPPLLTLPGGITAEYTEDNGPVTVAGPSLHVSDVDSPFLQSASVTITNHQANEADVLDASPNGSGIAMSYNPEVGTLSLSGAASAAAYQAVLRTVTFENRSHDPAVYDRIVSFIVGDVVTQSNTVTSTVKVESVNDLPLVDLNGADTPGNGTTVQYDQTHWGGAAVTIAQNLDLQDLDDSSLIAAAITLLDTPDGQAEYLQVDTDGTNISAVYQPSTGQLQLTGTESVVNYERVLRTVVYKNERLRPLTVDRRARFTVHDQEGVSNPTTSRIVVVPKLVMLPIILNYKPAVPESDEPNDDCRQAYPLAVNVPYDFLAEDEDDWYSFAINSDADVTVALTEYEPVEGQILVVGGDCDNPRLIGHNGDFSTNKQIHLNNLPADNYLIWIITDNIRPNGEPYRYKLEISTR